MAPTNYFAAADGKLWARLLLDQKFLPNFPKLTRPLSSTLRAASFPTPLVDAVAGDGCE